jgi:hypothetical protein
MPAASGVNSEAGGVWTLRDAERFKRAGTWPIALPQLPTISGLQLHLDAADPLTMFSATSGGSPVAADGGVARWEDKSGNGRHATQATSGNRPLRKTGVQNGRDVVRFDGDSDFMQRDSFSFFNATGFTGFVVARSDETEERWMLTWTIPSDSDDYGLIALRRSGGSPARNQFFFGGSTTAITETTETTGFAALTHRVTSGSMSAHRNGNLIGTQSVTATGTGSGGRNIPTRSVLNIGALVRPANPSGTLFFKGDIAEIIWYDSGLSDASRSAVESYLMTKWGIS